jgi:methyl-accepting chemotaxis protein
MSSGRRGGDQCTRAVGELRAMVSAIKRGELDTRMVADGLEPDERELATLVNDLADELVAPLRLASHSLSQIARGIIPEFVIDEYEGEFNTIKRNINTFLATMHGMHHEAQNLIMAVTSGRLRERGNDWDFEGEWRSLIAGMNSVVDAFEAPFQQVSTSIQDISQGHMPPLVRTTWRGDYRRLMLDVNQLISTLQRIQQSIVGLSQAAIAGKLGERIPDAFEGDWRQLTEGMNATLDAALAPIQEAGEILSRIADYDLRARVEGNYAGDHARIKDALNRTAETLNGALSQVAESTASVADGGKQITQAAALVRDGTERQARAVQEITERVNAVAADADDNARRSQVALERARSVVAVTMNGKTMAESMVVMMTEVVQAAESSGAIIQEINGIAEETDALAVSAGVEAVRVAASGRGFAVVADEVRRLAGQSKRAAGQMQVLLGRSVDNDESQAQGGGDQTRQAISGVVQEIQQISLQTNMLAVNAAVEAAHVAAASAGFEAVTGQVRDLAQRAKAAADRTTSLTNRARESAQSGSGLATELSRGLGSISDGVEAMTGLVEQIAGSTDQQRESMVQVITAMTPIRDVTEQNAVGAKASADVARTLGSATQTLTHLVPRFQLKTVANGGVESSDTDR